MADNINVYKVQFQSRITGRETQAYTYASSEAEAMSRFNNADYAAHEGTANKQGTSDGYESESTVRRKLGLDNSIDFKG